MDLVHNAFKHNVPPPESFDRAALLMSGSCDSKALTLQLAWWGRGLPSQRRSGDSMRRLCGAGMDHFLRKSCNTRDCRGAPLYSIPALPCRVQ